MKKTSLIVMAFLFVSALFFSCQKQEEVYEDSGDEILLQVTEAAENITDAGFSLPRGNCNARWNGNEGIIVLLFGYGFNNEAFYTSTKKLLSEEFGLYSDGGIILPLRYPDDFRNRISNLYEIINEQNVRGIIMMGAPERTHAALAKLQDDWEGQPAYSIFSFFPQDDILGEESTCNFVLEYARGTTDEATDGETELKIDEDAGEILCRSVNYIMSLPSPLKADSELIRHVQFIAGNRKVHRYTDSETGLQSVNHFVMEEN